MPSRIASPAGHTDWVNGVGVAPDGGLALSASADGTVKAWDLETHTEVHTLSGRTGWVRELAIDADWMNAAAGTPCGSHALCASANDKLEVWALNEPAGSP